MIEHPSPCLRAGRLCLCRLELLQGFESLILGLNSGLQVPPSATVHNRASGQLCELGRRSYCQAWLGSKAFQVDLTTNKPPARSRSSTPKLVDKRSPQPKLRTTLFEACSQYLQLFRVFGLPALTVRTLNSTCILGVVLGVD